MGRPYWEAGMTGTNLRDAADDQCVMVVSQDETNQFLSGA